MFGQEYKKLKDNYGDLQTQFSLLNTKYLKACNNLNHAEESNKLLLQRVEVLENMEEVNKQTILTQQKELNYLASKQSVLMTENSNLKEQMHHLIKGLEKYMTDVVKLTGRIPSATPDAVANEKVSV